MFFLDAKRPIATCSASTCDGCQVRDALQCHFGIKDLVHFLCLCLPSFLLGGAGVYHVNGWFLVPWLFIVVGFFGFAEIRVMCSHCPHYAEKDRSLKCWANYGAPKIWRYRPGPMTTKEKTIFWAGLVLVWGYPFYFIVFDFQWFLLIVYAISSAGFFLTLKTFFCTRCMNFACPLNDVDEDARLQFFKRNPDVAKAWKIDTA